MSSRFRNSLSFFSHKKYCDNKNKDPVDENIKNEKLDDVLGAIASKYQVFRNEDASIILDVNEERFKYAQFIEMEEEIDIYAGLNLNSMLRKLYILLNLLLKNNSPNVD